MFPNLEAEQKRHGLTNSDVAEILQVSRPTYESKKKTGNFSRSQLVTLCDYFKCNFEYLFWVKANQEQQSIDNLPLNRPA